MQTPPVILAAASGIIGTLFWLALVAAILWFLIWRLLRSDSSGTSAESASSESEDEASPEAANISEASLAETERVTGEGPPSLSETAGAKPRAINQAPSRAFTIWPLPVTQSGDSDPKSGEGDEVENSASASASVPALDTATAEEAAARFQVDLESGSARQDETLGILYNSEPEGADDLKDIKGVGKVLEGKLHDFGIYKFKQIAFWTDSAVAAFAERLTFKDRIYRDDWIAQAKDLHEKKHGEKL